jgi:hypothetical protein
VSFPSDATACLPVSASAWLNTANLTVPGPISLNGTLNCDADPTILFSGSAQLPFLYFSGVNYTSVLLTFTAGAGSTNGVPSQFASAAITGTSVSSADAVSASLLSLAAGSTVLLYSASNVSTSTTFSSSTASYAVSGDAGVLSGTDQGMALLMNSGCTGSTGSATSSGLYYTNLPGLVMGAVNVSGPASCDTTAATLFTASGTLASASYNGTALSNVFVSITVGQLAGRRHLLGGAVRGS